MPEPHARAGQPAGPDDLIDVAALLAAYHDITPDPSDPAQRVAFGTSGHRGSAFRGAFNEAHILAITEAICRYRSQRGYDGPLFLARDTHALSEPATRTALEVLVANGVDVRLDAHDGFTPTPALSHAVIVANRPADSSRHLADGIVVTPSHNPPDDGGFKYNPPNGGPADTDVTALDPGRGQPAARRARRRWRRWHPARPFDERSRRDDAARLPRRSTWATCRASSTSRRSARRGCASASIRWAAPRSPTGRAIAERYGLDLTVTNDRSSTRRSGS